MLFTGDICLEKDFLSEKKNNLKEYCLYKYRMSFIDIRFFYNPLPARFLPSQQEKIYLFLLTLFIRRFIREERSAEFTKTSHITSNHFSDNWVRLKATRINNPRIKRIPRPFIKIFFFTSFSINLLYFVKFCKDK